MTASTVTNKTLPLDEIEDIDSYATQEEMLLDLVVKVSENVMPIIDNAVNKIFSLHSSLYSFYYREE